MTWGWMFVYFGVVSVIGFIGMGMDKRKARTKNWRIPERRLLLIALIGGSPGVWYGMKRFRHKTQHAQFKYGLPLITAAQAILVYAVMDRFG